MGNDNWYVVRTNPQCELKATGELRRNGIRVYLPKHVYEVRNRKTGKVSVKHRPLYVGYLFIRFQDAPHFLTLRDCQGVKGVLRFLNDQDEWEPLAVAEKHVREIMQRQRAKDYDGREWDKKVLRDKYRSGNKLSVAEGPFRSFLATVVALRENGTVDTEIEIFGRTTKVTFSEPEYELQEVA